MPVQTQLDKQAQARNAAKKARALASKLEKAAGIGRTVNDSQRELMARKRSAERDVRIPTLSPEDRKERLRREADDVLWLRSYWRAFSPDEFYEPSEQQRQMIADFRSALTNGGDRATAASRGEGKTTFAIALSVKEILRGAIDFVILLGANAANAANMLETISMALADDPELLRYYPETCGPIAALENTAQRAGKQTVSGDRFDNGQPFEMAPTNFHWTGNKLIFPNVPGSPSAGAIVLSQGLDSAIRGMRIRNRRPDIVIIDDPDTDDTARNPDQAQKLLKKIDSGIAALGSQKNPVTRLALVTISSGSSVAAQLTDRKLYPSFRGVRQRFLLTPPPNKQLWEAFVDRCQKGWREAGDDVDEPPIPHEAHVFYLANRAKMDAGAKVSNKNRFNHNLRPEGGTVEVSALEHYYGWVARIGQENTSTEFDNDPPKDNSLLVSQVTPERILRVVGDWPQGQVGDDTRVITRGVDIRKIEIHYAVISGDPERTHRIIDYDVRQHGIKTTTVEQAESLIIDNLRDIADDWNTEPYTDTQGNDTPADLTLVDCGWVGSWREDGEYKTWATQPVETFCMEHGIDRFLPAKGDAPYRQPKPDRTIIIGDHWHINKGKGKQRKCDQVVWDADHWHLLVEELFMLPDEDVDRFEIFTPPNSGIWRNHIAFGNDITAGAKSFKQQMQQGTRSRKPRFVSDHWWDSLAMALVAMSIVAARVKKRKNRKPPRTLAQMAAGK